jgi:hypothetical protein
MILSLFFSASVAIIMNAWVCILSSLADDVSGLIRVRQRIEDLHDFLDILVVGLLEFNPVERSRDQLMPAIVGSKPSIVFVGFEESFDIRNLINILTLFLVELVLATVRSSSELSLSVLDSQGGHCDKHSRFHCYVFILVN